MPAIGDPFEHEVLVARPHVGRVFETTRVVRLADASPAGRLRLDACARYLQDIANDDSRDAGSANPTAWVARRTVIRVERSPVYLESLTSATWCSGIGSRWAERRSSMTGAAGGNIQAATLWVHVDMVSMRPIAVPAGFAEQFGSAAQGRSVSARLHLPTRPPPAATLRAFAWPLRFVDVDVLGHVNNSVYWAIVEEELAHRSCVGEPCTITLEHHEPVDLGCEVVAFVNDTPSGFDLWLTASASGDGDGGRAAAVVRASFGSEVPTDADTTATDTTATDTKARGT